MNNNKLKLTTAAAAALALSGVLVPSAQATYSAPHDKFFSHIHQQNKTFFPVDVDGFKDTTTLTFQHTADTTLTEFGVLNRDGEVVFSDNEPGTDKRFTFTWNGTPDAECGCAWYGADRYTMFVWDTTADGTVHFLSRTVRLK